MKGQKEIIVELVKHHLPAFRPYQDIALIMLSKDQLEQVKNSLATGIYLGTVSYGKNHLNKAEVTAYARSCVMNHLKKSRELNGNQVYGQTQSMVQSSSATKKLSDIDMDILSEELRAYVKTLV